MDYIPPVGGAVDDPYIDGNPATGTEGSIPPAAAIEHPMREIVNAIEALGGVPDGEDLTQLGAAIVAAVVAGQSPGVPTGTVISGYFATAPAEFIELAGVELSRTTYADLYNHAVANGLIVTEAAWQGGEYTMFSDGDGATTFRAPDIRGDFSRAWDHGRGVDVGRSLGSWQTDAFQGFDPVAGMPFIANTAAGEPYYNAGGGVVPADSRWDATAVNIDSDRYGRGFIVDDGVNGIPRIAAETRGRNVGLMFCIKY